MFSGFRLNVMEGYYRWCYETYLVEESHSYPEVTDVVLIYQPFFT